VNDETLAILVGGGPAPGINGVIAAATVEAHRSGARVLGIYDGFAHIARGDTSQVRELRDEDVAAELNRGGSMLRTSRTNPAKDERTLQTCVESLRAMGVRYLIAIGGDDTTYGASRIADEARGAMAVAAVPKTIDNDLPLAGTTPTFGYESARAAGATVVENLLVDAHAARRWYVVVSMGRTSGALALGIANAAGADVALIPEELPGENVDVASVAGVIAGAVVKRLAEGRPYGVAIVAEGIGERLAQTQASERSRDAYGNVRLAYVPLGAMICDALQETLAAAGVEMLVFPKEIGHELRSARPIAYDVEYTRLLGAGAARYLIDGGSGGLITLVEGCIVPVALADLRDPATGRTRVRRVDLASDFYQTARRFMARLDEEDLREPRLSLLAAQTRLRPAEFKERFSTALRV
jgi:6-phosphofructokinase